MTLRHRSDLEGPWGHFPSDIDLMAYVEGHSPTRYLIERSGMERVRRILGGLAAGRTMDSALHEHLFIGYEEFQRPWANSLNEPT